MFNFMERSHGCNVMECPVVGTYHFHFVIYATTSHDDQPLYGFGDCSKNEIRVKTHSILVPSQ